MLTATVQLPGSCGELVQGTYQGIPFHVTCPIDVYSQVQVKLYPGSSKVKGSAPAPKALDAVARTLSYLGRHDLDAELSIDSSLPIGKGMASSTADVAGAILATALALEQSLDPHQVAKIALSIEPSDGTFFPGIVAFDHREGKILQSLGEPPPVEIIVLDFGGEVDTIAFNQQERSAQLRQLEPQVIEALELVKHGFRESAPEMVGQGATLSALANQHILYKPQLDGVLSLARQVNALGINVAHSGTVIGVLLDPRWHDTPDIARFLCRQLPGLEKVYLARLVGGGQKATPPCPSGALSLPKGSQACRSI